MDGAEGAAKGKGEKKSRKGGEAGRRQIVMTSIRKDIYLSKMYEVPELHMTVVPTIHVWWLPPKLITWTTN